MSHDTQVAPAHAARQIAAGKPPEAFTLADIQSAIDQVHIAWGDACAAHPLTSPRARS
jgi:hypothetical protein